MHAKKKNTDWLWIRGLIPVRYNCLCFEIQEKKLWIFYSLNMRVCKIAKTETENGV